MLPPERYTVAPLPGFATRPPGLPRPLVLPQQFAAMLAWLRGRRPDAGQRQREDNLVAMLAREIDGESEGAEQ
jgi:hypothetical protein